MQRTTVLLVLLMALLWQSLAMARAGSTINVLVDQQHAALHWQEQGHHHHDDGTFHLDNSSESAQHLLSDAAGTTAIMLTPAALDFQLSGRHALCGRCGALAPYPFLDGPLRPPRRPA